jgi:hypothetical protein
VPGQGADAGTLLANFRDDTVSNMIVMLMRFITSAELQARQDHFAPFIMVGLEHCVQDFGCSCAVACGRRAGLSGRFVAAPFQRRRVATRQGCAGCRVDARPGLDRRLLERSSPARRQGARRGGRWPHETASTPLLCAHRAAWPPSSGPTPPLPHYAQGVADVDVPTFCRRFVEPMAEESDHVHAQALCDALQVGGPGWRRGGAGRPVFAPPTWGLQVDCSPAVLRQGVRGAMLRAAAYLTAGAELGGRGPAGQHPATPARHMPRLRHAPTTPSPPPTPPNPA